MYEKHIWRWDYSHLFRPEVGCGLNTEVGLNFKHSDTKLRVLYNGFNRKYIRTSGHLPMMVWVD